MSTTTATATFTANDTRELQRVALQECSNTLLEVLKTLFNEQVVDKTFEENIMYCHLLTFKFLDAHKTAEQYTKLIFEKTDVISRFQHWLNDTHFNIVDDKKYQKYFCRFYSFGRKGTSEETFQFSVNWDRRSWRNHSPIETIKQKQEYRKQHNSNFTNVSKDKKYSTYTPRNHHVNRNPRTPNQPTTEQVS